MILIPELIPESPKWLLTQGREKEVNILRFFTKAKYRLKHLFSYSNFNVKSIQTAIYDKI